MLYTGYPLLARLSAGSTRSFGACIMNGDAGLMFRDGGMRPRIGIYREAARYLPRDKVVYCHCEAGGRTRPAADLLARHGYDVRALRPGYRDLLSAGFPPAR